MPGTWTKLLAFLHLVVFLYALYVYLSGRFMPAKSAEPLARQQDIDLRLRAAQSLSTIRHE
jgi:hypothetical protein